MASEAKSKKSKSGRNDKTPPVIAVVVAMYNEEGNIDELFTRLEKTFDKIDGTPRYWFVDDGSTDNTSEKLRDLAKQHDHVSYIRLSRNFGHHTALFAGLDFAEGDIFIMMDADLQDQPEDIPKLLHAYNEGNDIVYAVRENRIENMGRRQVSGLFWHLVNFLSDHHAPVNQAVLRMFSQDVKKALTTMREKHRFLAGIFAWVGFRQTTVRVKHMPRHSGTSKYTFGKMLGQVLNAVTSFSVKPLRFINYAGFFIATSALISGIGLIILRLFAEHIYSGWTSIMVAIFFALGIQMIAIGMIGEYVGRIFQQSQQRPNYIVSEIV